MTISKYIEKTHTGKKNLEDLIKDSVVSDSDFDVSYNKESIVQNRKIDQENTLVNLTVSSGFNTINADMPYRRAELNKAEPQEVIFEFLMSQVMADDFESTLPRIVSNRLSIPTTDFYIENLAIYKNAYRLSFDVVYTRNAETVVNSIKCTGFVVLPRYTINDIYNELGINTPDYFVDKFPETFFEVGRTSYEIVRNFVYSKAIGRRATFEESASAKFAEQINFSENGRLNIDGLNISNSGYGVFLFENKEDWPLGGHYTYRAYRVKDDTPRSRREQLSAEDDNGFHDNLVDSLRGHLSTIKNIDNLLRPNFNPDDNINNKIVSKHYNYYKTDDTTKLYPYEIELGGAKYTSFLYYPRAELAQSDLTKEEAQEVISGIKDYVKNVLALPKDLYVIPDPIEYMYRPGQPEEQAISIFFLLVDVTKKENSLVKGDGAPLFLEEDVGTTWAVFPIFLIFAKNNKCQLLDMVTLMSSNNHIGFIEGAIDGFSIGDIEWWMIDAGLVRDSNNNRVTRIDEVNYTGLGGWGSGSWTITYPPGCIINVDKGTVTIHGKEFALKDSINPDGTPYTGGPAFTFPGSNYTCQEWSTRNWNARWGSDGYTVPGAFKEELETGIGNVDVDIDKIKYPDKMGLYSYLDLATIVNRKMNGFDF